MEKPQGRLRNDVAYLHASLAYYS